MKLVRKPRMSAEKMIETIEGMCEFYKKRIDDLFQQNKDMGSQLRQASDKYAALHAILTMISDEIEEN